MFNQVRSTYQNWVSADTRLWLYKIRNPGHFQNLREVINPSERGDFSLRPFDKHKCIFVHITKSAGTSVAKSLFGYLPYHYTARQYRVIFGRRAFGQYFKFAFVRNPWDRVYSAYRYLKAGGWNEKDEQWAANNLDGIETFESFVKEWLTPENTDRHIHFWPQERFVCDARGKIIVDYIAHFERVPQEFEIIKTKIGVGGVLATHNANPGAHYREVYDEESKGIVARVYARDIELFDYDFESTRIPTNTQGRLLD